MKKRWLLCALLLLLAPACAMAQARLARSAAAVTAQSDGTVPLYAQPHEDAAVLMAYYSGAPLEVLRSVGGGFYQVQAGGAQASLMGYMRAEHLLIDETAQRQVQPCFMRLEFNREAPVYAYCDEGAQRIGMCEQGKTYYAMSKNDGKWVQLFLPPKTHVWEEEERLTQGFVHLETGMARGYWQELDAWEAAPAESEMAQEQAIAKALEYLDDGGNGGIPDVYTNREALERMESRAFLRILEGSEQPDAWYVFFWQKRGRDAVYVQLNISGKDVLGAAQGYISEDDWGTYAVTPIL